MPIDTFKNFAVGTVSLGYDADDTSIVLTTGHGARFPSTPFSAIWFNSTDYTDAASDPNAEIIRVTARTSDTLTVERGQEDTAATVKNLGGKQYTIFQGLTAKTLNDDMSEIDKIVQTVDGSTFSSFAIAGSTVANRIPVDNTSPQWTEGVLAISSVIIPTSMDNFLKFTVNADLTATGIGSETFALFKDSGPSASRARAQTVSVIGHLYNVHITWRIQVSSTISQTWALRLGTQGAETATFNAAAWGGLNQFTFLIEEVRP